MTANTQKSVLEFLLHFFFTSTYFLIVKCVMSTPAYFAEKLYKGMKVLQKTHYILSLGLYDNDVCIKYRTMFYICESAGSRYR